MNIERRRALENTRQQQSIQELLDFLETQSDAEVENLLNKQRALHAFFEEIYLSFEAVIISLVKRKISGITYIISPIEYQDILAEQKMLLWEIIRSFDWHNFPHSGYAKRAFIDYLKKACGHLLNHFDGRKDVGLKQALLSSRDFQSRRPTEEEILRQEREATIRQCITQWKKECPQKFVNAVLMRLGKGVSAEEIAEQEQIAIDTVKTRIARGKRVLISLLLKHGISDFNESLLAKNSRFQFDSRERLLKERRKLFIKKFPAWRHLMPPKVAAVMEAFYGLNGCEPLFDYGETAEKFGMTKELVSVYLSHGSRILIGLKQPSNRSIQKKHEESLYHYWKGNRDQITLEPRDERVILMIFEEGKTQKEIARVSGLSQITISRIKRRFLEWIEQASDSQDANTFTKRRDPTYYTYSEVGA